MADNSAAVVPEEGVSGGTEAADAALGGASKASTTQGVAMPQTVATTRFMLEHLAGLLCFIAAATLVMSACERDAELDAWLNYTATRGAYNDAVAVLKATPGVDADTLRDVHAYAEMFRDVENLPRGGKGCEGGDPALRARLDVVYDPSVPCNLNWQYAGAFYFLMTVITTVGYGSFTPVTPAGRAFAAAFAVCGIIHFAWCLTLVSDRMLRLMSFLAQKAGGKPDGYRMNARATLRACTAWALVYILLLSAGFFAMQGGIWDFGDSLYFSVFTFSTVGLGDLAPRFRDGRPREFVVAGYFAYSFILLLGLALLSTWARGVTKFFVAQGSPVTLRGLFAKQRISIRDMARRITSAKRRSLHAKE